MALFYQYILLLIKKNIGKSLRSFYYIFCYFYVDTVHIKGNSSGLTLGERRGFTSWAVKMQYNHKMSVAEMRILRWISRNTRKDKIKNVDIRLKIAVAPSDEKIRKSCLRWFGYVQKNANNEPVRKSELIYVEEQK